MRRGPSNASMMAFITTGMALYSIRTQRVEQHREWMLRSYVVTFAFVTYRLGENLVTYTYRYGVRGDALRAVNPQIKDANIIYPGNVLTIPVVASFTPSRPCSSSWPK